MTGPQVQAQRTGGTPTADMLALWAQRPELRDWPGAPGAPLPTYANFLEYFTKWHTPGGLDPAQMAQTQMDGLYGGANYVGLARDDQGRNVSSDGKLVDAFGRPLDGSGSSIGFSNASTAGTADQMYASSPAAIAERARQAGVDAAASREAARLDQERRDAIALAARINATSGTPPATPPRVFTTGGLPGMLNANRPVDDRPMTGDPALTLDSGGYNPPQLLPANNTTALAPGEWRKYVPWALGALAVVLLIVAFMPKKKGAATS